MKLYLRKVNKDYVYDDEEIDLTGLVEIRVVTDYGVFAIQNSVDTLMVRTPENRMIVRPRDPSMVFLQLEGERQ